MMTTPDSAALVQATLAIPLLLLGLSHLAQPKLWIHFFGYLHGLGYNGVVLRTFALELIPAVSICTFHFVWSGPAVAISLYGLLLLLKVAVSLLVPAVGLKSLALADKKPDLSFLVAGGILLALSGICFWSIAH